MENKIKKISLFSVLILLICALGIVYATGDGSSDLNAVGGSSGIKKPIKVTKLPAPDDTPEDVGGYVIDVSDIDIEDIRALPCNLDSITMEKIVVEGPITRHTDDNPEISE